MKEKARMRKVIPCAVYDVEAMESWLSDLATEGWLLEEDGIFGPWAYFVPGPPRRVEYRLTSSLSSPEFTGPDEEARDLSITYGWEYLAKRKEFYIYRAMAENAREMDTDPQTQALILGAVQRRTVGTILTILVMGIVYPLFLLGKDSQMGLLIQYPLRFFSLFSFMLWFLLLSLLGCRHYRQLRQHLQAGQALDHHKPWRPLAHWNLAGSLVTAVVIVLLAVQVVLALITPA